MAVIENALRQLDEYEAALSLFPNELEDGPSQDRIDEYQAAVDAADGTFVLLLDVRCNLVPAQLCLLSSVSCRHSVPRA